MHVIEAVVVAVVNFGVCSVVRVRHLSIEWTNEPLANIVCDEATIFENSFLVMTLLVEQHVLMREKAEARADAQKMV